MNEKPHTVKSYEEQLQQLSNDLVVMGGNCETAFGNSTRPYPKRKTIMNNP